MIVFEKHTYSVQRNGDYEDIVATVNELLFMIGSLPDDYPIKNMWRVTTLIHDMMPEEQQVVIKKQEPHSC